MVGYSWTELVLESVPEQVQNANDKWKEAAENQDCLNGRNRPKFGRFPGLPVEPEGRHYAGRGSRYGRRLNQTPEIVADSRTNLDRYSHGTECGTLNPGNHPLRTSYRGAPYQSQFRSSGQSIVGRNGCFIDDKLVQCDTHERDRHRFSRTNCSTQSKPTLTQVSGTNTRTNFSMQTRKHGVSNSSGRQSSKDNVIDLTVTANMGIPNETKNKIEERPFHEDSFPIGYQLQKSHLKTHSVGRAGNQAVEQCASYGNQYGARIPSRNMMAPFMESRRPSFLPAIKEETVRGKSGSPTKNVHINCATFATISSKNRFTDNNRYLTCDDMQRRIQLIKALGGSKTPWDTRLVPFQLNVHPPNFSS